MVLLDLLVYLVRKELKDPLALLDHQELTELMVSQETMEMIAQMEIKENQ